MPAPPEDPVRKALNADDADAMKALVETGTISVNGIIADAPYIIWAATHKKKNILNYLLNAGADVNVKRKGIPFIFFVVTMNDVNILEKVIEKGADINARGDSGAQPSPLIGAIGFKAYDAANVLIDAGADLNIVSEGPSGGTALMYAVRANKLEIVKKLLEKGANVDAKNESGVTVLHALAKEYSTTPSKILDAILKWNPDLNVQDKDGNTPLHLAVKTNKIMMVKELTEAGANINLQNSDGNTPLHFAAYDGSSQIVDILLEHYPNAGIKNKKGQTPLHFAMHKVEGIAPDPDMIEKLYDACKDCAAVQDNEGNTPIHEAVLEGNTMAVAMLLDAVEDPDQFLTIKNNAGHTPVISAFLNQNHNIVDILLYGGVDVNQAIPEMDNMTMLVASIKMKNLDMLKTLVKISGYYQRDFEGGFLDFQMSNGQTALHYAASTDAVPYAKILIDAGAKTDIPDAEGKLAKDYAKSREMKALFGVDDEKYKGYSKSDAELFNQLFEEPNEWSCCPVCLAYVRRTDGCMYMKHQCESDARHEKLFQKFKDTRFKASGEIEWCTICGRITFGHKHFENSLANSTVMPPFAPISPAAEPGAERHFDSDCKKVGGGGFEEKVRRIHRLLGYACELQEEVGRISAKKARNELIEEVWNAGDVRNRAVPKMISNKKFEFPCTFPEDAKLESAPPAEKEYPDILRPADEAELQPIKHEAPDNDCAIELGPHDDGRPVYQFQHKQPDGSVYKHESYICAEDLEQLIRSQPIDGKCRIEPDKCKALLYPSELKDIVTPDFYETYRKLFNKAQAKEGGRRRKNRTKKRFRFRGAAKVPSLMKPVDMDTAECAPPQKVKAGKRRTFKKHQNKRKTQKNKMK